ncbi:bifunctional metallophosphatase/5'-nucleotidase, partial [Mesorhizobium sp. M00.F.Ca.ET.186.01.1.1]
ANVFKADGKELLLPTFKAEIGGKKFAFVGFVAEDTPVLTHPDNVKGLTFKNPVEVAKAVVPQLKKEVDHVIVVS